MKKQIIKCVCAIMIGSVMAAGSFGQTVQVSYDFQRGKQPERPKEKDKPKEDKKDSKKDEKKKP